jgi:hypothetical protein
MALKWIASVNGVKVFPKLPAQLNTYHKKWERNRRVQVAVNDMKSDIDALVELNQSQIPKELVEAAVAAATAHVTDAPATSPAICEDVDDKSDSAIGIVDGDYDDDSDIADTTPTPFLQWKSTAWPTSMVPPRSQAMYPADSLGQRFVGLERIGTEPVFTHLPDLEGVNKCTRGKDQQQLRRAPPPKPADGLGNIFGETEN